MKLKFFVAVTRYNLTTKDLYLPIHRKNLTLKTGQWKEDESPHHLGVTVEL